MGIGPVPAVRKLLPRLGLDDMDLTEMNEAFAVQVLAVLQGLAVKLDEAGTRLNVHGSGIGGGQGVAAVFEAAG